MKTNNYNNKIINSYIILGAIVCFCGVATILNNVYVLLLSTILMVTEFCINKKIEKVTMEDEMSIMNRNKASNFASKIILIIVAVSAMTIEVLLTFKVDINVTPFILSYVFILLGLDQIITGVKFKMLEDE